MSQRGGRGKASKKSTKRAAKKSTLARPPKGPGRPPFEPTDAQREKVKSLAGLGVAQERIRHYIRDSGEPISKNTLIKHFRTELDEGLLEAEALLLESLFNQAVGRAKVVEILADGTRKVVSERVKPDPACVIFCAKVRFGWKETSRHAHSGPDGGPIPVTSQFDLDRLSVEQLKQLEAILAVAESTPEPGGGEDEAGWRNGA